LDSWTNDDGTGNSEIIDAFAADTTKLRHFVIANETRGSSPVGMVRVLRRESRPSVKHTAEKDSKRDQRELNTTETSSRCSSQISRPDGQHRSFPLQTATTDQSVPTLRVITKCSRKTLVR
jgi:hypothetical protein